MQISDAWAVILTTNVNVAYTLIGYDFWSLISLEKVKGKLRKIELYRVSQQVTKNLEIVILLEKIVNLLLYEQIIAKPCQFDEVFSNCKFAFKNRQIASFIAKIAQNQFNLTNYFQIVISFEKFVKLHHSSAK